MIAYLGEVGTRSRFSMTMKWQVTRHGVNAWLLFKRSQHATFTAQPIKYFDTVTITVSAHYAKTLIQPNLFYTHVLQADNQYGEHSNPGEYEKKSSQQSQNIRFVRPPTEVKLARLKVRALLHLYTCLEKNVSLYKIFTPRQFLATGTNLQLATNLCFSCNFSLIANKPYFIEMFYKKKGGEQHLQVAVSTSCFLVSQ